MTISSNSHLKVKKSLGESLHCFALLYLGTIAHHVRCTLPSYTPKEWMWIITRSALVHLPEWSKLLGLEVTAALLDMLAGSQTSLDENVGHKLHSLRERDSWRRTANSSSTRRRKSYNSSLMSSRTTICILQVLPSMENISIFSTHLQHELKNCKKKIQQNIYCKKNKELHFAFFKRFLRWRPSPSSAHTQHELKNCKEPNRRYIARRKSYILLSSGPTFNGEENHLQKSMSERSVHHTPPKKKPNRTL
jgi:hypothetical protein